MRPAPALLALLGLLAATGPALAQLDPHHGHHQPGVGALAKQIWRDQAQEIKAMGQWRKAWYSEAPVYLVAFETGGDPNCMESL